MSAAGETGNGSLAVAVCHERTNGHRAQRAHRDGHRGEGRARSPAPCRIRATLPAAAGQQCRTALLCFPRGSRRLWRDGTRAGGGVGWTRAERPMHDDAPMRRCSFRFPLLSLRDLSACGSAERGKRSRRRGRPRCRSLASTAGVARVQDTHVSVRAFCPAVPTDYKSERPRPWAGTGAARARGARGKKTRQRRRAGQARPPRLSSAGHAMPAPAPAMHACFALLLHVSVARP